MGLLPPFMALVILPLSEAEGRGKGEEGKARRERLSMAERKGREDKGREVEMVNALR